MGNIFLSSSSENNETDAELNQNEREYINHIFRNNGFTPLESRTQIIKEKTKKTKAYESPIMIKRTEIKLEKDSVNKNIYFISFKYTSLFKFDVNLYFNATENFEKKGENNFLPSETFSSLSKHIPNISEGKDQTFLEKEAYFDISYLQDNKIFDKEYYDMIIECIVLKEDKEGNTKVECKLATYCKIIKANNEHGREEVKVKADIQKLNIKNIWFEMHDVYGLEDNSNNSNECEACYTNKKNTIFLPCMHSYACNECAVFVRLRGNKCPLCRQKISDTLLIEENKKIENLQSNNIASE